MKHNQLSQSHITLNNFLVGITSAFSVGLFVLSGALIINTEDTTANSALASGFDSNFDSQQGFSWIVGFGILGVLIGAVCFAIMAFVFAHRHHEI